MISLVSMHLQVEAANDGHAPRQGIGSDSHRPTVPLNDIHPACRAGRVLAQQNSVSGAATRLLIPSFGSAFLRLPFQHLTMWCFPKLLRFDVQRDKAILTRFLVAFHHVGRSVAGQMLSGRLQTLAVAAATGLQLATTS